MIVTAALLSGIMLFTAGCGGKKDDPKGYVEAFMALMTKGQVEEFVKYTGQTEEEARKSYDAMMDSVMKSIRDMGASAEYQERYKDIFKEIYSKAKYEVGEAEKTENGSYKVDISIQPITGIFTGINEEITDACAAYTNEKLDKGEEVSYEEMTNVMFDVMLSKMEERLNSISYGEAVTVPVTVTVQDGVYSIEDEETVGAKIGEAILDTTGLE